ncbi:MAG: LysR family transcriptional regulator [Rhizobiales bacterium]|nr:LysR family transcriptional regulator [Hyphomicrobiales bacterium]
MNWDDFRYFLAIARNNSLSAAGRALNVSQPTVSRRLAAMEARFGVKLFERTRAGYELSIPGAEIFDSVQHIEEELNGIDRRVFGQDWRLGGSLRVTCTEVMANLYLTPHLAAFLAKHPQIELSVVCTFQHLSLSRREADVAIRMTNKPPETLIGRRLANAAMATYMAIDKIEEAGENRGPAAWDWIGWQDESYNRMLISGPFPDAKIRHRVDDMQTMCAMVRAGLGVAILPCYMGDTDMGLRRAIAEPMVENVPDLWLLSHPDVKNVARVRAFTDFIAKKIIDDRDLFEGRRPQSFT